MEAAQCAGCSGCILHIEYAQTRSKMNMCHSFPSHSPPLQGKYFLFATMMDSDNPWKIWLCMEPLPGYVIFSLWSRRIRWSRELQSHYIIKMLCLCPEYAELNQYFHANKMCLLLRFFQCLDFIYKNSLPANIFSPLCLHGTALHISLFICYRKCCHPLFFFQP